MTVFTNFYKSINSAVVFCAAGAKSLGFYELKKLIKGLKFKFVNHFHCKFLLKNSENRKIFRLRRKIFGGGNSGKKGRVMGEFTPAIAP